MSRINKFADEYFNVASPERIIKIKKLSPTAIIPTRATPGSVGFDLYADFNFRPDFCTIWPEERKLIKTGISIELPKYHEAQIRPRSGLALKHMVTVLNSPGTIDWDYRNEIGIILINHGKEEFIINQGDRIAQMVITKTIEFENYEFEEVSELSDTIRGKGGFGSTGT